MVNVWVFEPGTALNAAWSSDNVSVFDCQLLRQMCCLHDSSVEQCSILITVVSAPILNFCTLTVCSAVLERRHCISLMCLGTCLGKSYLYSCSIVFCEDIPNISTNIQLGSLPVMLLHITTLVKWLCRSDLVLFWHPFFCNGYLKAVSGLLYTMGCLATAWSQLGFIDVFSGLWSQADSTL